jgi:hypothetical protein
MAKHERPMPLIFAPSMEKLWQTGYHCMQALVQQLCEFLGGYGGLIPARIDTGAQKQYGGLQQSELRLGFVQAASTEQKRQHFCGCENSLFTNGHRDHNAVLPPSTWMGDEGLDAQTLSKKPVFDIVNCGPRQRFVVLGDTGPFIVHNCTQAVARVIMTDGMLRIQPRYRCAMTSHDEGTFLVPDGEVDDAVPWIRQQMTKEPKYMKGLPLGVTVGASKRYGDAKPK